MKHQSRIKQINGQTIELEDGSRWEVAAGGAAEIANWAEGDKIEGEDFGIHAHLTNLRRQAEVLATLLR